ncbi:hypothetical protein [Isoptericola rhizosphaerae]|uniref:hypothetical protein n=1 Tax=Isoptericola rhizosphaerae TaxID=3377837 RepID=UPI00383A0718
MTSHESFKRRVRERMSRTGERYAAARRSLLPEPPPSGEVGPGWVSRPEVSDATIKENTGAQDPARHGVLTVSTDPVGQRTRMTLTHERLASPTAAEHWREYWGEWLAALATSDVPAG